MRLRDGIYLFIAVLTGLVISAINTSPNLDDSMISVIMIFISGGLLSFLYGTKPWLIALSVSIWIPLTNIYILQNYESLFVFIPGFAGSYFGYFVSNAIKQ